MAFPERAPGANVETPSAEVVLFSQRITRFFEGDLENITPESLDKFEATLIDLFRKEKRNNKERESILETLRPYVEMSSFGNGVLNWGRRVGNFEVLDHIYDNSPKPAVGVEGDSEKQIGTVLDGWFLSRVAAEAVRQRKELLKACLSFFASEREGGINVASLACGASREVAEFMAERPSYSGLSFNGYDLDPLAIQASHNRLAGFDERGDFQLTRTNIKSIEEQWQDDEEVDFMYSAGLIDYLPDKNIIDLMRKCDNRLAGDGVLLLGNFHPINQTRPVMEGALNWYLIHRTNDQLLKLAELAFSGKGASLVLAEPTGVNIFLAYSRDQEALDRFAAGLDTYVD